MIITLVAAATAVVAAATGYLVARRRAPSEPARLERRGRAGKPSGRGAASIKEAPKLKKDLPAIAELPLAVGDVIVSGMEERWLAGGLIARERGRVISALFVAPEGASTRAIAVFALPRTEIFWMEPAAVDIPAEPPATLEIGQAMLTRRGRLPVAVERVGQGAPHVGSEVLWATYEGGGREVAIVLSGEGRPLAWTGRRLDADEYERLGAGGGDESP